MAYLGEYICKLDAKGRLTVPSGLKKQFEEEGRQGFVLNRGFEGCLGMYPFSDWKKISERLDKLNMFVAKNRAFMRKFQNGATRLDLDASGRVLLPKDLMTYAGIEKDVVLFAYSDRVEIWDKKKYDEMMNEDMDDFADLAEDVLGGDDE